MSDSTVEDRQAEGWRSHLVRQVTYILASAPWTLVSSLAGGLVTYIVMILLARYHGLETVGQFRLMISIVAMMSLTTLLDSGKLLIRHLVQGDRGIVGPLLINRIRWSFLGVAGGLLTAAVLYQRGDALAPAIAVVALTLPILHPTNLYVQINQSRRQFRLNAFINLAQYGTIAALAVIWVLLDWYIITFFVLFFLTTALFNSWFTLRAPECYETPAPHADRVSREARKLSVSGLLQAVLEHADKFLISYFLGLEALGLYAIGVSTGRLLLHFAKPLLIIYLPDLVEKRFSTQLQILSFVALTIFGVLIALILPYYMAWSFGADKMNAYPIAAVIVAGMGLHFVGVTKYYSAVYHKGSSLRVPVLTNFVTVPLVIGYLVAALSLGGAHALLLCAVSYPLRELINIIVISVLNHRFKKDPEAEAEIQSASPAS